MGDSAIVDDIDPRLIMLERCPLFDAFLAQGGISGATRIAWELAYRSWRVNRRVNRFPSGQLVMSKKSDSESFDVGWFRCA